jgi:hypothetical protein
VCFAMFHFRVPDAHRAYMESDCRDASMRLGVGSSTLTARSDGGSPAAAARPVAYSAHCDLEGDGSPKRSGSMVARDSVLSPSSRIVVEVIRSSIQIRNCGVGDLCWACGWGNGPDTIQHCAHVAQILANLGIKYGRLGREGGLLTGDVIAAVNNVRVEGPRWRGA